MKGGVPCLGAIFCRPGKNIVVDDGDERMSGGNGYIQSSDLESKSGGLSEPSVLEAASDGEKERQIIKSGRSPTSEKRRSQQVPPAPVSPQQLNVTHHDLRSGSELLKPEAANGDHQMCALFAYQNESSTGDCGLAFNSAEKAEYYCTGKTGLSRVAEWVSNVHNMAPFLDAPQTQTEEGEEDRPHDKTVEVTLKMPAAGRSVSPELSPPKAQFSGALGFQRAISSLGPFGSLKTLDLSANSFVRITPGCLPKSLHSLDLSRNSIVAIEGLKELTRLRVLNLSSNRISRIGNGLSSCSSLKEVYLAGNKISEVEGLHRLSKLVVLDLSFNKLTTTKSLGQIAANYKSLQAFNLLGNAVHSNLGDEQMRRYVVGICPQLVFLNKQALKSSVGSREALGKELKGGSKSVAKPSKRGGSGHHQLVSTTHRRTHHHSGTMVALGAV